VFLGGGPTDHERPIVNLLITYCVGVDYFNPSAICRAPECEGTVLEWSAEVTVHSTTVAIIPVANVNIVVD
jgi:hypothetical protein